MPEITKVKFGNGSITYRSEVEAKPATSETTGNVTVNNAAIPGVPSYFDTSFMLSVLGVEGGIEFSNVFHWNGVVLSDDQDAPYRSIEDAAVRQIAPALRAAADLIEKDIARFDQKLDPPED